MDYLNPFEKTRGRSSSDNGNLGASYVFPKMWKERPDHVIFQNNDINNDQIQITHQEDQANSRVENWQVT